MMCSPSILRWYNTLGVRVDALCKLETLQFVIWVKVAYTCISNKPPLVIEHASPLTRSVGLLAHTTFGGGGGIM